MRAYKTALKAVKKASCEREARAVIEELVGAINKLPRISRRPSARTLM